MTGYLFLSIFTTFLPIMETQKIAVFPGSFDPFTNGHADLVRRALPLFDHIVVAIGINGEKKGMFPAQVRQKSIQELYEENARITVDVFDTLTADYCRRIGAKFILRGLRSAADWEYEQGIALVNKQLQPEIETVFLAADPALSCVSSSVVRDLLRHQAGISAFVPSAVEQTIREYFPCKA